MELSTIQSSVCPLFDEQNDKQVSPRAWNYNTTLSAAQQQSIADASDPSNSDMDWSKGKLRA